MIITVLSGNKTCKIPASPGDNLLEKLREAKLAPDAFCGGMGTCGKCKVSVNHREVLACQYRVEGDVTVRLSGSTKNAILTAGKTVPASLKPWNDGFMLAFDIGTTTVAAYLLSPEGREAACASMLNPQASYGADVVTRIRLAMSGKQEAMTLAVRKGMAELIHKLCSRAGITPEHIGVIAPVGNPCMQQLFLGMPTDNLGRIPFAPAITRAEAVSASPYFGECPNAKLLIVPDLSGYIGADTIAGILAGGIHRREQTTLLVDIGTNGEMVLCHNGRLTACSAAAGPALEGACIKFGMRGADGAIDHIWEEDGLLQFSVIGKNRAAPKGICGSGLIDAAAFMKKHGLLNHRGRIIDRDEREGERYFKLCDNVYLTQNDIRQLQLAKGAIAAGIYLMARELGITPDKIDSVLLAGAFGSYMDPDSACTIGLLPEGLRGKITAAGNLAGAGAKLLAGNRLLLPETERLIRQIRFLDLAALPEFQHVFAQCMML